VLADDGGVALSVTLVDCRSQAARAPAMTIDAAMARVAFNFAPSWCVDGKFYQQNVVVA
jgi:hypothetical protein